MIVTKDNALEVLRDKGTKFIYPLKMGGGVSELAFSELLSVAEELTRLYKSEDLIPKKILSELYLISVGIECENYHFKQDLLSNMSESVMHCFNMLISGESVDDGKSGVPRII